MAAARLASRFAELARETVETREGSVIELRGDEALAVFESARAAIRAAVELQVRFVEETVADPALPFPVGIGLDAGEAVRVTAATEAARSTWLLGSAASPAPAEILASREVAHLARKVEGIKYVEHGAIRLKGLIDPIDVIKVRPELADSGAGCRLPACARSRRGAGCRGPGGHATRTRACAPSRRRTLPISSDARR